jgi:tetratricopeptide (TPR) repeat protein
VSDTSIPYEGNPAGLVDALDALVHDQPEQAVVVAAQGLDSSTDPTERALYGWGLARARHEVGDIAAACAAYEQAVADARTGGDAAVVARVRTSQALALADAGDVTLALAVLDEAADLVAPDGRQRVLNQRCLVLYYAGRLPEALACADEARALAVAHGDVLTEGRVAVNRGIVHLQMGELDRAQADFERARSVAEADHQELMRCVVEHNLALVHARRGDFARALGAFARAVDGLDALAAPARTLANLERDRAECLLLAGFPAEAAARAGRAEDLAVACGNVTTAAECALLAAQAHLRARAGPAGAQAARRARAAFAAAGRAGWEVCADFLALEAELEAELSAGSGASGPATPDRAARGALAEDLRRFGREPEALQVQVIGALLDLRRDRLDDAVAQLARAGPARRRGPLDLRVRAWHADALVHLAAGRRAEARHAIECGMRVIEEHVALLAAPDIRAAVAAQGARLAGLGLALAREGGDAADVFHWADRWRAGTLTLLALQGTGDDVITGLLSDLRSVTTSSWHVEPGSREAASLDRRAAGLQRAVTDRSRSIPGDAPVRPATDAAAVRAALGPRRLVEYAVLDGSLLAIVVRPDAEPRVVELGPADHLDQEIVFVSAALRRLAMAAGPAAAADAIGHVEAGLADLDRRLVEPLDTGGAPLVVVPAHHLHDLAWSGLPSLRSRAVTVAPSAAAWMAAGGERVHPALPRLGVITGPGLEEADGEAHDVARQWASAADAGVAGEGAAPVAAASTVAEGLALVERVDVLHIAAHGRFCAENPTLSSITLADGELTVYDLARVPAVPPVVVLAACSLGRAARFGDEVVGFAHALLGLGARAVVAPVLAVPDAATRPIMVALHRELRAGTAPADALAAARSGIDPGNAAEVLAACAFTCLGTR